jgi:hypothetical protein
MELSLSRPRRLSERRHRDRDLAARSPRRARRRALNTNGIGYQVAGMQAMVNACWNSQVAVVIATGPLIAGEIGGSGTIAGVQSGLNGAPVQLWTCNSGSNQQWKLG